ncbi:MAG: C-GCAxxG-C-C family protein [Candidatus Coproplasma sp.]
MGEVMSMGVRADRAREMFLQGYNCSQSVVGAFADLFGFDNVTAMKFAEGLGGGMGRMRLTCGAVAAMATLASMKMSSGEPGDLKLRGEIYAVIQKMAGEFKDNNGSVICAELLGAALPKDNGSTPEERTPDYYRRRPCADKIYQCALLVEKYLCEE